MPAKIKQQQTAEITAPYFATQSSEQPRFVVSEDGYFIYANDSFCALASIKEEDIKTTKANTVLFLQNIKTDKNLNKITNGEHKVTFRDNNEPQSFHFDWLSSSNDKRFLVASSIQPNKASKTQKFTGKFHERPDNKPDHQETLENFLSLSTDIMVITTKTGKIIQANEKFHERLGYKDNTLSKLNFKKLLPSTDKITFKKNKDGETSFEVEMQREDKKSCWIKWRKKEIGKHVYYVGHDLTNEKNHEIERAKRQRQLREAEEIGRMGHWHWTLGEDKVEWSEEIFRIFGTDKSSFKPTIDHLSTLVLRSDLRLVARAFERAIMEQKDYDMEFCIKPVNGEIRSVRCRGRCELDKDGDVIALYGIMQDITESMLYERDLTAAKDTAERAYSAKTQFLANMSHELRTPLNAIIGFSEMMQHQLLGPIGNEKYLDYISGIRESGEHLLDLIGDILDMSKIEAGKYDLDLEEFRIEKILKTAANMVQTRAHESSITLSISPLKNKNLKIIADRRAIMQIMLNILSNAVKFTKDNGTVSIQCTEREDYLSIKISDNGIGIPPNKLASITKPFEQVSASYTRDHEGSGLGLAITKELVEMHGGAIAIESKLNIGTTVTLRIPYDASKT